MRDRKNARVDAAVGLLLLLLLLVGCAPGPGLSPPTADQPGASPLYLLTGAGFQKWEVNDETPKRAALYNNIPPGKIVTYMADGNVYHAYADPDSKSLYVGDEAAYQKYLSMSQGRQLCERVMGQNNQEFWTCFEEYRAVGASPRGR
jgi:hypothetical protein